MKKVIQKGDWDGEPIYREETPEETLLRQLQEAGLKEIVKVDLSKLDIIFSSVEEYSWDSKVTGSKGDILVMIAIN